MSTLTPTIKRMADNPNLTPADEAIAKIQEKALDSLREQQKKQAEISAQILAAVNSADPSMQNQAVNAVISSKPKIAIQNLRTFQGDVAEAIKKQNASVLTIALAEKERKYRPVIQSTPIVAPVPMPVPLQPQIVYQPEDGEPKNHHTLIIVTSIFLIILGVGVMVGFYQFQKKGSEAPQNIQAINQNIISYNKTGSIALDDLSGVALTEKLTSEKNQTTLSANDILYISFTKKDVKGVDTLVTPDQFLSLFSNDVPPALLRAFGNEMMFGFFNGGVNESYLLIELDSFDNTYSGMLAWEKTMNKDIGMLFSKRVLAITSIPSSTGTSTTATTTQVINYDIGASGAFEDDTIKNKDIRILKNNKGETVLLYTFINKNTLLITSGENVLREVLTRISSENIVR